MIVDNMQAEAYEDEHVHKVYSAISSHFSKTRYKPWPIVEHFLSTQPPGAVGVDAGTGNGKYLAVNSDIFIVASDRSEELVRIASTRSDRSAAVVADNLSLPHPRARFDFAISIAVIHHFSSRARRVEAVKNVLDCIRPCCEADTGAEALFFVWALEQKGSRRGWDQGDEQDVMVPWVLKGASHESKDRTLLRYYHLYEQGELEDDIKSAGGEVVRSGYDRDNWWAVAIRRS